MQEKGINLIAKVPPASNKKGFFSKEEFNINLKAGLVTCPANQTVSTVPKRKSKKQIQRAAKGIIKFPKETCNACPLKDKCINSKSGRTIRIHENEDLLVKNKPIHCRHYSEFGIVDIDLLRHPKLQFSYRFLQTILQGIEFFPCIELAVGKDPRCFIQPGDKIKLYLSAIKKGISIKKGFLRGFFFHTEFLLPFAFLNNSYYFILR